VKKNQEYKRFMGGIIAFRRIIGEMLAVFLISALHAAVVA